MSARNKANNRANQQPQLAAGFLVTFVTSLLDSTPIHRWDMGPELIFCHFLAKMRFTDILSELLYIYVNGFM